MNLTLDYLKSNRKWLVRNILVWGNSDSAQSMMLMTEHNATMRIMLSENTVGGSRQLIEYSELVDHRGNALPEEISNPVVMLIPRNSTRCYLAGQPSSTGFAIARESLTCELDHDGLVDLMIMEVEQ